MPAPKEQRAKDKRICGFWANTYHNENILNEDRKDNWYEDEEFIKYHNLKVSMVNYNKRDELLAKWEL